jgi:DNA-binding GntR family transcriptional regulator
MGIMVLAMALQRPALVVSSPIPLWEQVVKHVRAAVASGDLQPGERLPAVRDLADAWEVGYSTMTHAMAVLQEEGLLVARAGKGTFVAEPADPR